MKDQLFGPVEFGGGARWNPLASAQDPPALRIAHAIIDIALVMRGTTPNLNLGNADSYIWAGEWELALDELEVVIAQQPGNQLAETMLSRAKSIVLSPSVSMP